MIPGRAIARPVFRKRLKNFKKVLDNSGKP